MVVIAGKDPERKEPYNNAMNPTTAAGVLTGAGLKSSWLPGAVRWNAAVAGYVERYAPEREGYRSVEPAKGP